MFHVLIKEQRLHLSGDSSIRCLVYRHVHQLVSPNTLHQRPAWDHIALLAGFCMSARQLARESFDRY